MTFGSLCSLLSYDYCSKQTSKVLLLFLGQGTSTRLKLGHGRNGQGLARKVLFTCMELREQAQVPFTQAAFASVSETSCRSASVCHLCKWSFVSEHPLLCTKFYLCKWRVCMHAVTQMELCMCVHAYSHAATATATPWAGLGCQAGKIGDRCSRAKCICPKI